MWRAITGARSPGGRTRTSPDSTGKISDWCDSWPGSSGWPTGSTAPTRRQSPAFAARCRGAGPASRCWRPARRGWSCGTRSVRPGCSRKPSAPRSGSNGPSRAGARSPHRRGPPTPPGPGGARGRPGGGRAPRPGGGPGPRGSGAGRGAAGGGGGREGMKQRHVAQYPPEHYLNRELSWLEFNARVLEEARDPATPLLERLKFLAIFSSNLDEFFEIRVAGLQQQLYVGLEPQDYGTDGLDAQAQLARVTERAHQLVAEQYRVLADEVFPGLAAHGIERWTFDRLDQAERAHIDQVFETSVYPVLTPLAIDPGHTFPHVHNKSLNIALLIEGPHQDRTQRLFAVVQVPSVLPRVMLLPGGGERLRFLLLEDLIAARLGELFGGFQVLGHTVFRVTRNTDLVINEDEAEDLLETIEETLRQRIRGEAVRLEISADADDPFVQMLTDALDLEARDVYRVPGPVDLTALMALHRQGGSRALRDEPLMPWAPAPFAGADDIFAVIRSQDVLVHHPYDSFGCVVDFIERAADDPQVLAIKQTLYRTSGLSPIITALGRAAQNGKQVTALVELRARHEEEANITWARSLEQAGVHVVYGVLGLKTHCKAALVVRR